MCSAFTTPIFFRAVDVIFIHGVYALAVLLVHSGYITPIYTHMIQIRAVDAVIESVQGYHQNLYKATHILYDSRMTLPLLCVY